MLAFANRILFVGYGAVAQCTLPILVKHLTVPPRNITVIDFEDRRGPPAVDRAGVRFVRDRVTPENLGARARPASLGRRPPDRPGLEHRLLRDPPVVPRPRRAVRQHVGRGLGPVRRGAENKHPTERTLYWRHMNIRRMMAQVERAGARRPCSSTAPIPGLISHFTKQGLLDIARAAARRQEGRRARRPRGSRSIVEDRDVQPPGA